MSAQQPLPPASGRRGIAVREVAKSETVLLLVDFINPLDFDGAEALQISAIAAARATAKLRRRMRADRLQCLFANDNYGVWHSDFKELWAKCSAAGGTPAKMARALRPARNDFTILKPRHSAFYSTPLDLVLRQLRCKRVVLTGLAADNCVLFTAMDAYLRGYSLWIPADCTAAESDEARKEALLHMQRVLKADIRPSSAWR